MITDDPATPGDGHWEINMVLIIIALMPTTLRLVYHAQAGQGSPIAQQFFHL